MKNFLWKIKRFFQFKKQRIERGFDDSSLWELFSDLAEYILPRIKAFKEMERSGYPSYFSEFEENGSFSKEEYNELLLNGQRDPNVAAGRIKPMDAWNKTLSKIIYAFEYVVYTQTGKDLKEEGRFYKHYFGFDPRDKSYECNACIRYEYKTKDGGLLYMFKEPADKSDVITKTIYSNCELEDYAYACADEGLKLFAKHFFSLWD